MKRYYPKKAKAIKVYETESGAQFAAAPKKKIYREESVQRPVVRLLDQIERFTRKLTYFHVPNQLLKTSALRKIYHGLGIRAGVPDLPVPLDGGRMIWIEMKYETNKKKRGKVQTSDDQDDFHARLRALGHPVYTVQEKNGADASKAVQAILAEYGVIDFRLTHPNQDKKYDWARIIEELNDYDSAESFIDQHGDAIEKALEIVARLGLQS